MNKALKVISISCAFIFSIAAAAIAGALLAVWDTGNVQTAKSIIFESRAEKAEHEQKTQQVVKKDGNIKDAVDAAMDKGAVDAAIDMGAKVSGFDSIFLPESHGDEVKSDIDDVPDDGQDEDSSDEDEDLSDEVEDMSDDAEDDSVEITAEISNVPVIVRAGAMDEVILNNYTLTANGPPTTLFGGSTLDPVESYPLPFTKVTPDYFADALFIGDSRMQGFGLWSKVNATFYAQTAFQLYKYKTFKVVQMPEGKVPIFDVMPYDAFTKIYIKVGLNEMGMSDEAFINVYTQFIEDLRAMQPRAIIYIHAILPVTASKSNTDKVHNNENINRRNAVLKNFAEMMKCYYVDVGPYVSDETGALIADSASDGIHMSGKYMNKWVEGLCEQAVAWPQ